MVFKIDSDTIWDIAVRYSDYPSDILDMMEMFEDGLSIPEISDIIYGRSRFQHIAHILLEIDPNIDRSRITQKLVSVKERKPYARRCALIPLTEDQRHIILSSLLGNASMHTKYNKNGTMSSRISFNNSEKEIEYLEYKHNVLENLVSGNGIAHKSGITYEFQLKSNCAFDEIRDLVTTDRDGRRVVTINEQWLDEISTPFDIGIWFMDTGRVYLNRGYRRLSFHLHTKTYEEADMIQRWANDVSGVDLPLRTSGSQYSLVSTKQSVIDEFIAFASPYVIDAMRWKLLE